VLCEKDAGDESAEVWKGRQDKLRSNQESYIPFGFTVSCYTKSAKTVTFFASTTDLKMSQASTDIGRRAESYCLEALHASGSGESRAQPRHIGVLRRVMLSGHPPIARWTPPNC